MPVKFGKLSHRITKKSIIDRIPPRPFGKRFLASHNRKKKKPPHPKKKKNQFNLTNEEFWSAVVLFPKFRKEIIDILVLSEKKTTGK